MSDFIKGVTKYIQGIAGEVSRKTDEVITVQGMKSQQRMSRREIEKAYIELGKIVLMKYRDGVAVAEEAVPHCEEITRLEEQIAQLDEDIAAYKAQNAAEAEEEPDVDEVIDEVVNEEDIEIEGLDEEEPVKEEPVEE